MRWLRRLAILLVALTATSGALTFATPEPPQAKANVLCDVGGSAGSAVRGAIGIGNPVGDACNAIADPVLGVAGHVLDPLKEAAASIGKGVFDQITTWAADGAVWLLGEVVALTEKTTSPNLLSKGFLRQYRGMASIATVLALLMLVFAVLESLGRGEGGMLARVFFVNVPLAAIATSAAFVLVQLLIATTDGFSEAIAHSTASDTHAFFKGAVEALAQTGGAAGALTGGPTGAAQVPLFVGFIAAIVAAFAAFFVWIELLMRDAAIYVVALFMPMVIAASIWPRWTSPLRRTAELLIVVVVSKFIIVAIIALAASLLAHTGGKVEQILAAGALLLLACFSPFVLFKLVPFAEGAVNSVYERQSAGGASVQAIHTASSVQMMRHSARANWAGSADGGSSTGGSDKGGGKGAPKGRPGGSGGGGSSAEPAGASGGAAGAAALPIAAGIGAAKASKAGAERLAGTATAKGSAGAVGGASSSESSGAKAGGADGRSPRPSAEQGTSAAKQASTSSARPGPEPTEASGGKAPGPGAKPPRPSGDASTAGKSNTTERQP